MEESMRIGSRLKYTQLACISCLAFAYEKAVSSQERTPEAVLEELKAIGEPDFDPTRKQEPGYLEKYKRDQHILYQKKAALLLDLCLAYPDDERVPEWMNRRWMLLAWNQKPADVADEVLADIDSLLPQIRHPAVLRDAKYW